MTRSVVACMEDLFFRSKVEATARHLNVPVQFTDAAGLVGACGRPDVAAALVELNDDAVGEIAKLRGGGGQREMPVVGFLSHVDRDLAERAKKSGATRVLARSEFSETLPDLLMDLVAPGTRREVQEEPELPDE